MANKSGTMGKTTNLLLGGILIMLVTLFSINLLSANDDTVFGNDDELTQTVTTAEQRLYSLSLQNGYVGGYTTWQDDVTNEVVAYRFLEESIQWKNNNDSSIETVTELLPSDTSDWDLLYCSTSDNGEFYSLLQSSLFSKDIKQYYVVSFETNSDEVIDYQLVLKGDKVSLTQTPTKEDYKLNGWFYNNTYWDIDTSRVYSSMTLDASWTSTANTIIYHNVTGAFHQNPATFSEDDGYVFLTDAVKTGYVFGGWYSDYYLMSSINYIDTANSTTVNAYAKFLLQDYNIIYSLNGGTNSSRNPNTYTIETEFTLQEPTKAGANFLGWKLNGVFFKEITIKNMTTDFVVEAVWETLQYNIVYSLNGGTMLYSNPSIYTVDDGEIVLNVPVKEGYEAKWSLYSDALVEVTSLNSDLLQQMSSTTITLYAFYDADSIEGVVFEDVDQYGNEYFYMYYGYAPQSVVDDEDIISQLDAQKLTDINGHYILNGIKYEKHEVESYTDSYTYGNGEAVVSGETRYFCYEPIKWRIIQTVGAIQLLSEYVLKEEIIYHTNVTRSINGSTINANNYRYSNINVWMDGDFATAGFSTEQLENVKTISTTYGQFYALTYTNFTNESLGFLSSDDADQSRCALVTDYALATGINQDENGCAEYWTSSTGTSSWNFMRSVRADGSMDTNRVVWTTGIGIRPTFTFIDFTIVS